MSDGVVFADILAVAQDLVVVRCPQADGAILGVCRMPSAAAMPAATWFTAVDGTTLPLIAHPTAQGLVVEAVIAGTPLAVRILGTGTRTLASEAYPWTAWSRASGPALWPARLAQGTHLLLGLMVVALLLIAISTRRRRSARRCAVRPVGSRRSRSDGSPAPLSAGCWVSAGTASPASRRHPGARMGDAMTNDDLSALTDLVTAVIDILTIVLIGWAAWDALVNRWIAGALKRGITAIAIWTIFSSLIGVAAPAQPLPAELPATLYDASVGPLNAVVNPLLPSGLATGVQPGLNLVAMGVAVSQAIWSGLTGSGIIMVPIACCIIMWAIEVATGGVWVSVGLKALLWTLLFTLAAGPITAQFPTLVLTTAGQLMATVTRAVTALAAPPAVVAAPSAPTWDATTVSTAANSAKAPPWLDSIVAPFIGSCNRSLPPAALQALRAVSYIGEGADGIVSTLYYCDPTGEATDPKGILQLATPRTTSYNLLMVNADPAAWVAAHFTTPDGTVTNGAGITAGFIKLGATADASTGIITAYKQAITESSLKLENQIASLQAQNGSPIAVSILEQQLMGLSKYQPPSVVPISTIPALTVIRSFITSYYAANANAGTILAQVMAADPDAWGELWFYQGNPAALAAANAAAPLGLPPPYPVATPFLGGAGNPVNPNAIVRDEAGVATPSHELSIWHLWDFMRGLITLLVMAVAESGMAGVILLIKVLVFALAPVIVVAAIFLVAGGVFVICLAYPCAAFIALFPGRWSMLLDWSKGVFWVFCWVPIMAVGISMCSFTSSDLVTAAVAILKGLPVIGAPATAAGASAGTSLFGGVGMITGSFLQTLAGLFLIVSSPLAANLVFHPGLHGISSLTGALMRNVSAVASGVAAGPLLAAGGALAAGARGGARGGRIAGRARGLARAMPSLSGAALAGEMANGGAARRLRASLGGGADWAVHTGAAASGALGRWAQAAGADGSLTRALAQGTAALAGRAATGAAVALGAFSDASRLQDGQRRAGVRALFSPTGITSAADRVSQGVSAMMAGDLVAARALAQGKGEHPGDAEERIRASAAALDRARVRRLVQRRRRRTGSWWRCGRGRAGSSAAAGGGRGAAGQRQSPRPARAWRRAPPPPRSASRRRGSRRGAPGRRPPPPRRRARSRGEARACRRRARPRPRQRRSPAGDARGRDLPARAGRGGWRPARPRGPATAASGGGRDGGGRGGGRARPAPAAGAQARPWAGQRAVHHPGARARRAGALGRACGPGAAGAAGRRARTDRSAHGHGARGHGRRGALGGPGAAGPRRRPGAGDRLRHRAAAGGRGHDRGRHARGGDRAQHGGTAGSAPAASPGRRPPPGAGIQRGAGSPWRGGSRRRLCRLPCGARPGRRTAAACSPARAIPAARWCARRWRAPPRRSGSRAPAAVPGRSARAAR